jgi:WhiB family transcriptional regulator, redox-sensing transcriptional regulator
MTKKTLIPVEAVVSTPPAAQHHTESDGSFGADVRGRVFLPHRFDGPSREDDQWQDRALCSQTDPEAFFPEKGGSTREAKQICLGCEVRAECLEYALAHDERFGIWGGLSERERRRLKRGIS